MSSAILYLAIVAIWACVLVPRWLRRPHEQQSDQEAVFEPYDSGEPEAEAGPADGEEITGAWEPADGDPYAEAPDFDTQSEQGAAAYREPVAWEEPEVPAGLEYPAETSYSVTATYSAEVTYSAQTAADEPVADEPVVGEPAAGEPVGGGPVAQSVAPDEYYDAAAYAGDDQHHVHVTHGGPAYDQRYPEFPQGAPGPSPHIVLARRRTLTMVLLITVAVMGAAFIGLTPWWTAVPPFLMLGAYLLLLREAAQADAERAHRWAEAHARAVRAARRAELARERAREAEAVSAAEPAAQIISLSELARQIQKNEPYDQYADAEIRAVGD